MGSGADTPPKPPGHQTHPPVFAACENPVGGELVWCVVCVCPVALGNTGLRRRWQAICGSLLRMTVPIDLRRGKAGFSPSGENRGSSLSGD